MKNLNKTNFIVNAIVFLAIGSLSFNNKFITKLIYPSLNLSKESTIYYGKTIEDKYAVLENMDNKEVKGWYKEEEMLCDSVLSGIPSRQILKKDLENYVYSSNMRGGFPRMAGENVFFVRSYLKEKIQKIIYRKNLGSENIELFNANEFYESKQFFNIDYFEPSSDGKYIAFGLSSNGNELAIIHIIDVENKKVLPERIKNAKYGHINWISGTHSFFYSQTNEPGPNLDSKGLRQTAKVKLHVVGENAETDRVTFSREANTDIVLDSIDLPLIFTYPKSSYALLAVYKGTDRYASLYYALTDDIKKVSSTKGLWKRLSTAENKIVDFAIYGEEAYMLEFQTNSNGIVKKFSFKDLKEQKTLIESHDEIFESLMLCENALFLKKDKNGVSSVIRLDINNGLIKDIKLPFQGYVGIKYSNEFLTNSSVSSNLYFALESWDKEVAVYCYNPSSDKIIKTNLREQSIYGYPDDIIVKELEIPSYDGTMVPLSIVYSRAVKLNGENPVIISGYGAYGISTNASFDLARLAWLRKGGIFAFAHVRGGGEKGENWYKGGYQSTKMNSWKDFIACAEYLIKNKYTSSKKLAARGASAGAITVGRAITERPDLFKAAVIEVGALNTLKLEKSRNASRGNEFGSVNDSIGFKNLLEMDTYHHINDKVIYPSILFTAGINDSRIDPWQSGKAVARFQEVSRNNENVILYRVTNLGHFGDSDKIALLTDIYGFLFWSLNHKI
jgi:prolyl oligopeptidase